MLHDLLFRLRWLLRRKSVEQELDEELRFHRERQVAKYLECGLVEDEARRRVGIEFGAVEKVKEECRDSRGVRIMDTLLKDLRYGARLLRRSPGFAVVSVLTLALGIGANTAIFSVLYSILLRPLPFHDASHLVVINETTPRVGTVSVSWPDFVDWKAQARCFSAITSAVGFGFNLSGVAQPENLGGQAVSPNFLSVLGVRPILGRDFDPSEAKPGTAPVVLLSDAFWQSRFGGDRDAVGRTILLNGRSFTIVGVLPPEFRWMEHVDVLEPIGVWLADHPDSSNRGNRDDLAAIGRLAPAVSMLTARTEMEGIAARIAKAYPASNGQFGVLLRPIRDLFVGEIRDAVIVLFAAVVFVLLIACANVGNLFLMRGVSRSREIALRMAIGATRGRIAAQMVAESLILTSLGGAAGLVLAVAAIQGLAHLIPHSMLAGATLDLNKPALLLAGFVVVGCALFFGIAPALHSAKTDVQEELKEGGRLVSSSSGPGRWRGALATAEIALALILLIGAGLMTRSLYRLLSVDAGVRPERVLTMQMSLRTAQYNKEPAVLNFWTRLLDGVRALPGIERAALGTNLPLSDEHDRTDMTLEGMAIPKPGSFPHPDVHIVSPGYVAALGIPVLRGRAFTEMDNENAPHVALINRRIARQYFGARDPIGKRFFFGNPSTDVPRWITIVGVVGDTKLYGLENPARLEVYVPFRQAVSGSMALVIRSAVDPAALTSEVRRVVASIDKDQPVFAVATMQQMIRASVSTRQITFVVLGCFSALALTLAAIGIYGVISWSVAQRTHEIGIRIALGAQPRSVLSMVLGQGAKIAGTGALIGTLASLVLTRLMKSLLFSVSSADPLTFVTVIVALACVALLACWIPAWRTLRVDPVSVLRCE